MSKIMGRGTSVCSDSTCVNPGTFLAYCEANPITSCVDNDGCCPAGCSDSNDNDCGVILVDFGATESENIYSLTEWNTPLKDWYTHYVNIGPEGTTIGTGANGAYNYQGVKGENKTFLAGERIVVTWYNNDSNNRVFTPRISFNDPDRIFSGVTGTWYDMSKVNISSGGMAISNYEIPFDMNARLVNINVNYGNTKEIICDKINYVPR